MNIPVDIPSGPTITILIKDYNELLQRDAWLSDLEEAGVDNWQGIDEAIAIRRQRAEECDTPPQPKVLDPAPVAG